VNDLALWEDVFDLPTSKTVIPAFSQDLVALGYVAFYLLAGKSIEDAIDFHPLDPRQDQNWPSTDSKFKSFIFRLLELATPFQNAEEARQALLQMPPPQPQESLLVTGEIEDSKSKRKLYRPSVWLLSMMGLMVLAALLWFLIQKLSQKQASPQEAVICCLSNISGVPNGKYNYAGESGGSGIYVLREPNLILRNQILEKIIQNRYPKLELNYQPGTSLETVIENVSSGKLDFAVTSRVDQLNSPLRQKEFAHDGLVLFVAFSYSKRDKSLPKALQGEISFQQLRDLYTGKIKNWRELGGANFPNLPVKLYFPPEQESVRIFEQRVLQSPTAIAEFRKLQQSQVSGDSLITSRILQKVLQDFEDGDIGSIGFGKLSKVFGQCSVYPLALRTDNQPAVQSLIQDNGKPIEPSTDLCNAKGSYGYNYQAFKTGSYPLKYDLVVVYPDDNSRRPIGEKFADMLRTEEVQHLLEKAGLVPLQSNKQ
jgi:ABC-type phosphate transport system substrate-binding protein